MTASAAVSAAASAAATPLVLTSPAGLRAEFHDGGTLHRLAFGADLAVNLFVGNALDGGATNLVLRALAPSVGHTLLLGPRSPTAWHADAAGELQGAGEWNGLRYRIVFRLAAGAPAWFWHLRIENAAAVPVTADLILLHDLALAPYAAVRLNEYYVSQYIDHAPLTHAEHGAVIASRQNQAVGGRHPWCAIGSLGRAVAHATDALQVHGLATRANRAAPGLVDGLPSMRLQHEHAMAALQGAPFTLASGAAVERGWFGSVQADHPAATSAADLAVVDAALALPEAQPPAWRDDAPTRAAPANLFTTAPPLDAVALTEADLDAHFGTSRRHVERDAAGAVLGFFCGTDRHVALRAKELAVLRPHGQVLRTGTLLVPDESALTSTAWMAGVFHSMLTQGHVSINRALSTLRSYLGLYRAQGLRVFVDAGAGWRLLDQPSAFEMRPDACRWVYRHAGGVIEVRSDARGDGRGEPQALGLEIDVIDGAPLRCLVCLHVALNGDDGATPGPVRWWRDGAAVVFAPGHASELGRRFPNGEWRLEPAAGTVIAAVGGDEALFADGASRALPHLVLTTAPARAARFRFVGGFVADGPDVPSAAATGLVEGRLGSALRVVAPSATGGLGERLDRLVELMPWLRQNALIHYLAPRGLEQFSGGGWGTRDVCQGPAELLLAHGHSAPMRELLLRVMRAQRSDGDWPQWFMFFARDAAIRAGDSHGDIVYWPLLALAQYLIASGDASVLDERVPFAPARGARTGRGHTVWAHALRALALTRRRRIAGTALAAYGHGDWNDALQPVDPAMREHLCSAWTVTLHHQMLTTLATALRRVGRAAAATRLERQAGAVKRDFLALLLVDGVLTGYALFDEPGAATILSAAAAAESSESKSAKSSASASASSPPPPSPASARPRGDRAIRYLLHPRDATSGVHYSALAMIHAILEGLFDPAQMRAHLALIDAHLSGPDGVRLFDRPLPYRGGLQRQFQRAESASFFGREIGLMYTHAHLRYAQALAHVGEAGRFFHALCQANPIGLADIVPSARARQSNCYYSSSDAAFADRYQASAEYERVRAGTVALEGGWRVYSSGAGILQGLIVRHLCGLRLEADALLIDPVLPAALDGTRVAVDLLGAPLEIDYRVRGAGCGVTALWLDERPLAFTLEPNPYRRGAARVAWADLAAAPTTGRSRRLRVDVG